MPLARAIDVLVPPEVILDRFIRNELKRQDGCSGYSGRLDLDKVEPESLRSFLELNQTTMNEALRLEGVNASAGVEHPPFHFDYVEVTDETVNAHAFQHGGFAFIVITLPLVERLWQVSNALSHSPLIVNPLELDRAAHPDFLQPLLFQIQLQFVVSHEYTHHIHRHCDGSTDEEMRVWTEFRGGVASGGIGSQARELDADGYAAYLVLSHLLRGEGREVALEGLNAMMVGSMEADGLLLIYYFLAVMAFFCSLWRGHWEATDVYHLTHPPAPSRIKHAIQVAEMWCGQNESLPSSWFSPTKFQELFRVAASLIDEQTKQTWDAQMAFLRSPEGTRYDEELFEAFEVLRHTHHGPRENLTFESSTSA